MKFSHYKKEIEKTGDDTYQIVLEYDRDDETDVLIQLMSFGSYINVISPPKIKKEICSRLKIQVELFEW